MAFESLVIWEKGILLLFLVIALFRIADALRSIAYAVKSLTFSPIRVQVSGEKSVELLELTEESAHSLKEQLKRGGALK